jgi:hypothetical protein
MSTSTILIIFAIAVGLVVALLAAQGWGAKVTPIDTKRESDKDGDDA